MTHTPSFKIHEDILQLVPSLPESRLDSDPCVAAMVRFELRTIRAMAASIWPSAEAQDGYPGLFGHPCGKLAYASSCVPKPAVSFSADTMRRSWGIGQDQSVVLYLGRPHAHKGFPLFLELARYAASKNLPYSFVHGGAPSTDASAYECVRYVGYVTDRGSAYSAADAVVHPNQYAYLDLGLLEALSLGCMNVMTSVGGHRPITKCLPALPTISGSIESAWEALEQTLWQKKHGSQPATEYVRFWADNHSSELFVTNHQEAFRSL